MHLLKVNVTMKDDANYIDQWIKQKHSMQDRYDYFLDRINSKECEECRIEVTKSSINMVLKFTDRDKLVNFLSTNPPAKLDNNSLLSHEMSISEE